MTEIATPQTGPDAEDISEAGKAPKWVPTILLHVFYPDSRKVGFGWWLFVFSTYAAFFAHKAGADPLLDASTWLICTAFSSALIGGGTLMDAKNDLELAKLATAKAPANAPAP